VISHMQRDTWTHQTVTESGGGPYGAERPLLAADNDQVERRTGRAAGVCPTCR
jgi:hypothetical protein